MGAEIWKTPLVAIADPLSLQKWAKQASDAEIPLSLVKVASAESFGESYLNLLDALANTPKFNEAAIARDLFEKGEPAILDGQANKTVLAAAVAFCKARNNKSGLPATKKEAWGKCQRHIADWLSAFSSDAERLQTAIEVDRFFHATTGSLSVDDAVMQFMEESFGEPLPDLGDIVQWYFTDIRVKYRKNITLMAEQVVCPVCGGLHDEGAPCSRCSKAETALKESKKALDAKRWKDALAKANEVLSVWKDNGEAEEIRRNAEAGIEEERRCREEAEEAERKRKEREALERQQKVDSLKADFDVACKSADWRKAESIRKQIVGLGDRSVDWDIEINRRKESYKTDREEDCKRALADFIDALAQNNITLAEAKFAEAKEAEKTLREKCGIRTWAKQISGAERDLDKRRRENLVDSLQPVQSLVSKGSTSGQPTVEVSWRPSAGGTPVAKWRIIRRQKDGGGGGKTLPELDGTNCSFADRGADLRLGIEYIYEVTPLAKTDTGLKANEKAVSRSEPAICLAKLSADALKESRGEGETGVWGVATLRWTLPVGVDVSSGVARLSLSRKDGKLRDVDVTDFGGRFDDADVEVGQTQEYSLSLSLGGRDSGTALVRVAVEQMRQPEPVRDLRAKRNPNGRWLVEWTWPDGMANALVGPVTGDVTDGARLEATPGARPITSALYGVDRGVEMFIADGVDGIAVCTFKDRHGGGRIYSRVEVVPIVVRQAQVSYGFIQKSGGLFFRKSVPPVFVVWSDGATLPDLVLVEGRGGRPSHKEAGTTVAEIKARRLDAPVLVTLPDCVKPERTKLFLANPERDADRFRIALPVAVPKSIMKQQ